MVVGNLNEKETQKFYDLINKGVILCQWITKDNYESLKGCTLTDAEWEDIVNKKEDAFADLVSNLVEEEF